MSLRNCVPLTLHLSDSITELITSNAILIYFYVYTKDIYMQ